MKPQITIYTRVYNTEKYLKQCLDSVINQTYKNFKHIVIDNGCTDGCTEILKKYAEEYPWVQLIRYEKNRRGIIVNEYIDTPYFCQVDSDDWLEPDFLEKTLEIAQNGDFDIVSTGNYFHIVSTREKLEQSINEQLVLEKEAFSKFYCLYHRNFRTVWGKLYKSEIYKNAVIVSDKVKLKYGSDTLLTFSALRNAKKVFIDNSVLYNYRVHPLSTSYQYDSKQSDSDIFLFNDAIDFLSQYGEISPQNLHFIYMVYANAIKDTVKNLVNSKLSAQEKLKEYIKIFARPETHNALSINNDTIENVKCELMFGLLSFAIEIKADFDKVSQILNILSPECASAINKDTVKLFARNDSFKALLFKDDKKLLSEYLLTLILNGDKLTKVYDFPLMLGNLASENSLASTIKNTEFIRLYTDAYSLIWNSQNSEALSEMTEILFSGKELNCAEDFLNLYVTLAALENHVEAFLFGNIQKAYLFIDEKRFDEARQIVNDLVEMGAGESEDVIELQKLL